MAAEAQAQPLVSEALPTTEPTAPVDAEAPARRSYFERAAAPATWPQPTFTATAVHVIASQITPKVLAVIHPRP